MQFCVVPRKSLLALTLALAFGAAHASASLETKGTPAATPVTMTTFGVDVPAKQGLKTVLPEGWELLLHQSAVLPERISWADGQSWVSAMDQFAAEGRLSALVDWDKQKVFLRSQAVAAAEAAKRVPALAPAAVQIAQAVEAPVAVAPTPTVLPAIALAVAEKSAPIEPASALAPSAVSDIGSEISELSASLKAGALPVPALTVGASSAVSGLSDATSPAVAAVSDQLPATPRKPGRHSRMPVAAPVQADGSVASDVAAFFGGTSPATPTVRLTESSVQVQAISSVPTVSAAGVPAPSAARAVNRPSATSQTFAAAEPGKSETAAYNRRAVSDVLERVAGVHGFVVSYDTDIAARFDGPVTVLAADMGEDLKLMSRALGPASPVAFELYRPSQLVRVVASEPGKRGLVVYDRPYTGVVRPHRLVRALNDASSFVADSTAGANRFQDVAPVPAVAAYPSRPVAEVNAPSMAFEPPIAVVTVPAVPQLHFRVDIDESLQEKLGQFLAAQGYTLDWKVDEVLNAEKVLESSGKSIKEVLAFLPKLGLSADIDSISNTKLVVVRPGDEAIDKQ